MKMRLKKSCIGVLVPVLLSLFWGSSSWGQSTDVENQQVKIENKTSRKKVKGSLNTGAVNANNPILSGVSGGTSKYRFQGFLTHLPRLRNDQDTTTDILLRGDYTINKRHRVRLQQSFTKLYTKTRSQYEMQPSDTVLAHYYAFEDKPLGTSLQWRTGLNIPISNSSSRDDLITRLTGSLIAIKSFFGGKVLGIAVPYARYHFYEYNMKKGGGHLPWFTLGAAVTGIYMITSKLSFSTSLGYNFEGQRKSQFEDDPKQLNNGTYAFDLDLSYQVGSSLSVSLAYNQGANYMQDGRYELALYDNEVSRVTAGLIYTF